MPISAERDVQRVLAASQVPAYNTAAVARRSEVPAATFRAWERRYGFPLPNRGAARQRLYSEQDVQAIIWLRDRIAEGLTISAALALLRNRLSQPPTLHSLSRSYGLDAIDRAVATPTSALASRLEAALLAFDAAQATLILSEAFGLYSLEQVNLDVIQPALHRIGDGWEDGTIDVAQEHFASSYIRQRLTALLEVANPSQSERLAVAACGPDEWHELGLLMVALFLTRHGWRVVYLGASLPPGEIERYLAELQPSAVVLSATTEAAGAAVADIIRRLAELSPPGLALGFGGSAFAVSPDLRDAVPGLYLGENAATAAERLNRAVATGHEGRSVPA